MAKLNPHPRPTVEKCPKCGAPMIRWPNGTSGCTRDHATAEEIIYQKGDDMTQLSDLIIQAQDIGRRLAGQNPQQPVESFERELVACEQDLDAIWIQVIAAMTKETANVKSADVS